MVSRIRLSFSPSIHLHSILRDSTLAHAGLGISIALVVVALGNGPLAQPAKSGQVEGGAAPYQEVLTVGTPDDGRTQIAQSSRGAREAVQGVPAAAATAVALASSFLAPTPPAAPTATPVPTPAMTADDGKTLRVGIQSGHWKSNELPAELASLRTSTGAQGNGWREMDVNLDIARRVVAILQSQNIQVDLIPATVPVQYKADAFVALHGDANSPSLSGYKLARASWSAVPAKDDALLKAVSDEYRVGTGLSEHRATITVNMTAYYAFNSRLLDHAVAPTTPAVILEMGFLTNTTDRSLLMSQQDRVAQAIAKGIVRFLGR